MLLVLGGRAERRSDYGPEPCTTLYHMQQLSIAILREKRAKSINDLGFINLPPRLFLVALNVLDASHCETINFG